MDTETIKRGLPAMHPGELLRDDIIPALDRSKTEIARLLGISRQTLYDILDEKQPVRRHGAPGWGSSLATGPCSGSISSAPTTWSARSATSICPPFPPWVA